MTCCRPNQNYRRQNNKKCRKPIINLSLISVLKRINGHSHKPNRHLFTRRHLSKNKALRVRTNRAQQLRIELLLAFPITKATRLEKSSRISNSCRIVHAAKHRGSLTATPHTKTNEWRRSIILFRWSTITYRMKHESQRTT